MCAIIVRDIHIIYLENGEEILSTEQIVSCVDWGRQLKNYQYVFLLHLNDVFAESYGSVFENPETIGDGTIYRVKQSNGNVELSYIGKVGIKEYR